jgi:hypothetical protein
MTLMRLRIPMSYAVCYNQFHDVEPGEAEEDGFLVNWSDFSEDILQVVRMEIIDGQWVFPTKNKKIIDLGWYPSGKVNGQYKLVLVDEEWTELRVFYSRDKIEIRDTLEEWMIEGV